jgi:protein-disulfide isomerase
MRLAPALVAATFCLFIVSELVAQSPRRPAARRPAAQPVAPTPTSTPVPAPAPTADLTTPLANVNGQAITVADLDQSTIQQLAQLDQQLAEARQKIVEMQVNTVLLDTEARRRRLTGKQLYDLEVTKRIADPTEAEISKFVAENSEEFAGADLQRVRPDIIAYMREQREEKLTATLVDRLRTANPVVSRADINSPNLSPATVVATVGGQPVTAEVINARLKPILYNLRMNTYRAERAALDRTVDDVLLIAEANKRSVGPETIVRTEITEKLRHATDDEVVKYYGEHKATINAELETVRPQLANYLDQQEQLRLERALSDRLRKGAAIRILLTEPQSPAQTIATDGAAARGDAKAAVTLVEFTDFECPACGAMYPMIEEVLKSYGNRVRFVVRNFPLQRHPHARKAAEAAAAANAQGKFFEYVDLLFHNQKDLEVASLKKFATQAGLDRARFDAELDGGTYAAAVKRDLDDGEVYGIGSTPTIFINGVTIAPENYSVEGIRAEIDRAFAAVGSKPSP